MRAANDRLVAGEFSIQRKSGACHPYERVKPQNAKTQFVCQADQVVAPSGVSHLVNEHSVEFVLSQQVVNSTGKRDVRAQKAVDCRNVSSAAKPDRNAMCKEAPPRLREVFPGGRALGNATFGPNAQSESRKHQSRAKKPHQRNHARVSRDAY